MQLEMAFKRCFPRPWRALDVPAAGVFVAPKGLPGHLSPLGVWLICCSACAQDAWSIHKGSCGLGYLDEGVGTGGLSAAACPHLCAWV